MVCLVMWKFACDPKFMEILKQVYETESLKTSFLESNFTG